MGILGFVCTQYPDIRLCIVFLPILTFTAGMVSIPSYPNYMITNMKIIGAFKLTKRLACLPPV